MGELLESWVHLWTAYEQAAHCARPTASPWRRPGRCTTNICSLLSMLVTANDDVHDRFRLSSICRWWRMSSLTLRASSLRRLGPRRCCRP